MSSRVLHALLEALAAATAATDVWVTDTQPSEWRVVEAVGPHAATLGAGAWPRGGVVSFVVESDQPAALVPRAGVELSADVESVLGRLPSSLLVVPCAGDAGTVGAIGLVDKAGGGSFSFDDLELATMLGPVAGAALLAEREPEVADPATLAAGLLRLSSANPARYERVAAVVSAMLSAP
jgi:hypothetical protein